MIDSNINVSSTKALNAWVDIESTPAVTCTCSNFLQDFTIYRESDTSKFFGFGVVHKAVINLINEDNTLSHIKIGDRLDIGFKDDRNQYVRPYPYLYVAEIEQNETTNTLTIVAYDTLYKLSLYTIKQLGVTAPYSASEILTKAASLLNITIRESEDLFRLDLGSELNLSGEETLREFFDAVAEINGLIYYAQPLNVVKFKGISQSDTPVLTVDKDMYYDLVTATTRGLTKLCHVTELGDNILASWDTHSNPVTQILRENPFYTLNQNTYDYLVELLMHLGYGGTLSSTQLNCEWRGDPRLEVGDRVAFVTDDGSLATVFLVDDTLEYNGSITEITSWEFVQEENKDFSNPANIGDRINQTFARVDKVNKKIDLVATDVGTTRAELAEIRLTTDDISLRVEKIENNEIEIDIDLENDTNFIALKERVGALEISSDAITASVSNLEVTVNQTIDEAINNLDSSLKEVIQDNDAINSEIVTIKESISALEIEADSITASVSNLETSFTTQINEAVENLESELNATENTLTTEITTVKENVASLKLESDEIIASVKSLESTTAGSIDAVNYNFNELAKEVSLKVDSEAVSIVVEQALSEGVDKVVTASKNYTFDDTGLNISSSDSEISTTVTEDGMRIYKNNNEVLSVDNGGVTAHDLYAKTFLIIGENSRLEDRGNRTACFWIGKAGG